MNILKIFVSIACLVMTFIMSISIISADDVPAELTIIEPSTQKVTEPQTTDPLSFSEEVESISITTTAPITEPFIVSTVTSAEQESLVTTIITNEEKASETVSSETITTPTAEVTFNNLTYNFDTKFENSLIVGDSLAIELMSFNLVNEKNISGIEGPLSVKASMPFFRLIESNKPQKIYIMLGKDNLSSSRTISIVNTLHQAYLDGIIYIVGVPNASNNKDIDDYNINLQNSAQNAGYKFILPCEITEDMLNEEGTSLNEYGFSKLLEQF